MVGSGPGPEPGSGLGPDLIRLLDQIRSWAWTSGWSSDSGPWLNPGTWSSVLGSGQWEMRRVGTEGGRRRRGSPSQDGGGVGGG